MIRNVKAITASSYLSMFFLGVAASLIGAAARNIGLSPYQIGLMLAVQNIGFMPSILLSGALADTYEKPKILFVGSLILAVSFFTFYLSDLFWVNLVIMFFIGAGIATYEGVTDVMLLAIHTKRESFHISVNHFFVTFGATMITVYLIFLQMNWRDSVIQSGIVVLGLAVVFGLTKLKNKQTRTEPYLERLKILSRDRLVVFLSIATLLAVGLEVGSIGILTTFLTELRGFTQVTSKIGLVVFLVGIASGRVFVGYFTHKEQISRYILTLFGLSSLSFTGLFFLNLGSLIYVAIYLAGIAISALLPLMITLAGLIYKDMAGTVIGTIKLAIPLGGILIPFLMSIIARYLSLQASLLLFTVAPLLAFLILFFDIRHIKSYDAAPAIETTG
jgi:predicted MFS family arabinose efflux permease